MSAAYRKACEDATAKGFALLGKAPATAMGYSTDKRKRRRQHRRNAKNLVNAGTILNAKAPRGSTPHVVATWNLFQARYWGR